MTWQGRIFGSSEELFRGVEGFFKIEALTVTVPLPTARVTTSSSVVPLRTGDIAFGERVGGADFNLGRIVFSGTGLRAGTITLDDGSRMAGLTGGTITGFRYYYNDLLSNVIDQGLPYDPVMSRESNLRLTAVISLPNVSATSLMNAIRQSYIQENQQIFLNFLSSFSHVYTGDNGTNIIGGFNGNDRLIGLGGNDVLFGNGGNDTLDGGSGTDGLNGGAGNDFYLPGPRAADTPVGDSVSDSGTAAGEIDTISYSNATGAVTVDLNSLDGDQNAGWARGLIVTGIERVIGSNFNDLLMGKDLQETVTGTANDILIGGRGDDTLVGFSGNDSLSGGEGFDTLVGGSGNDVALFSASSSQIDIFFSGGFYYVASQGGGLDRLESVEFLGLTNGVFSLGSLPQSGRSVFVGDNGGNPVTGTSGSDLLFGRGGNDTMRGNAGSDFLDGEAGNDVLNGGTGADTMYGGYGRDVYYVDTASDKTVETSSSLSTGGNDLIVSSVSRALGNYFEQLTLTGTASLNGTGNSLANVIVGNSGRNKLNGSSGNDTITGNAGNDTITGGAGRDIMTGGSGADDFDYNSITETGKTSGTRDVIKDFTHGSDDIDLSTIDANGSAAGNAGFKFLAAKGAAFTGVKGQLKWSQINAAGTASDKTIIEGDINGDRRADFQIELTGLKTLTAGDFIL